MAKKDQKVALRERALKMIDKGMTSAQVGEKLGVKKMTVAAWVAHRTMGRYS